MIHDLISGQMNFLVKIHLLAASLLVLAPSLSAQSCFVFEREMETLFLAHQPKTPVPQQELERIRARCPEPSQRMLLIYNFFRAVDAFQSTTLTDREAYDQAVHYYNRSATHFSVLSELDLQDPFFKVFYQRADEFELALDDLAAQVGVISRTNSYSNAGYTRGAASRTTSGNSSYRQSNSNSYYAAAGSSQVNWNRENAILPERADIDATRSQARLAGSGAQSWETSSNTRTSSANQRTRSAAPATTRSLDTYAGVTYVGSLNQIDPLTYLRFSRSNAASNMRTAATSGTSGTSAPQPEELWQYRYDDPSQSVVRGNEAPQANARTQAPGATATGTTIFVNIGSSQALTNRPGKSSPAIAELPYGTAVYRVPGSAPSYQQGEFYLQVQTIDGQIGWMPQARLIEDGRLAVVVEPVNAENQGGIVPFYPAEPIVLAKYVDGKALVVGRDGRKSGWVSDLATLSIAEEDLQIADMIAEAMSHTSVYARRAKLADIQQHPAYFQSPLGLVVDRLVVEEAQRN